MMQEVIDRVNQLRKVDGQTEMLTFYDRKGLLIGKSEIPGVPETPKEPPEEDDLQDLNPDIINQDYGLDEQHHDEPNLVEKAKDELKLLPDDSNDTAHDTANEPDLDTSDYFIQFQPAPQLQLQ